MESFYCMLALFYGFYIQVTESSWLSWEVHTILVPILYLSELKVPKDEVKESEFKSRKWP